MVQRDLVLSFTVEHYDEETDEYDGDIEVSIPAKYEVCPRCKGRGKHVNPNIDGHGISAEEWDRDWSFEEREDYFNGVYDVPCEECKGSRVVLVPDEEHADPELLKEYWERQRAAADYRREREYERRMGF